jgi:hypothetical protein
VRQNRGGPFIRGGQKIAEIAEIAEIPEIVETGGCLSP